MGIELGDLIVRTRTAQNKSRQDLARDSGVSYPYVSQIETGEREPSLKTMAKLAQALGLPIEELASAAPSSWAGVSGDSLSGIGTLSSRTSESVPVPDRLPADQEKVLFSVRRRLRELPPLERLEVLAELTREAAREASEGGR